MSNLSSVRSRAASLHADQQSYLCGAYEQLPVNLVEHDELIHFKPID